MDGPIRPLPATLGGGVLIFFFRFHSAVLAGRRRAPRGRALLLLSFYNYCIRQTIRKLELTYHNQLRIGFGKTVWCGGNVPPCRRLKLICASRGV